jgi:hypothetical protein
MTVTATGTLFVAAATLIFSARSGKTYNKVKTQNNSKFSGRARSSAVCAGV